MDDSTPRSPDPQAPQNDALPDDQSLLSQHHTPAYPYPQIDHKRSFWHSWTHVSGAFVLMLGLIGLSYYLGSKQSTPSARTSNQSAASTTAKQSTSASSASQLGLEKTKNYGNKYANGLLPVGDKKYVTSGAKKGYVYLCQANFVPESQAGAQVRGLWFVNNNTQWDINKKAAVNGQVKWDHQTTITIKDGIRTILTNDLPDHHTGTFPVSSSDDAYQYDRNPNSIKPQALTYNLTATPQAGTPQCMGGEVGVMLTGVALFNAFDAGGRDAGAWEVQDSCDGHPQSAGEYHYHTMSRCIKDVSVNQVIGFALDGFPITGPKVDDNNFLTTDDLDECHGINSEYKLDGKTATGYHYVMTQDFPYSVSCFRAKAVQPPGQHENAGQQQPSTNQQSKQPTQGSGQQNTSAPPPRQQVPVQR